MELQENGWSGKKISENSSIHDDNLNYIEAVMVRIDSIFDYLSENVQMQL